MNDLRQAHASLWLATCDFNASKISSDELEAIRARIKTRLPTFEQGARRQALKSWLMTTATGLTNRSG
jgi:hypothetical protein